MFDKGTNEWLKKREIIKNRNGFYFCGHCQNYNPSHYDQYTGYCACDYIECPLVTDYRDASEFEARVARKQKIKRAFTDIEGACTINPHCPDGCPDMLCTECRLKYARLKAEEEMEDAR